MAQKIQLPVRDLWPPGAGPLEQDIVEKLASGEARILVDPRWKLT